MQFRRGAHVAWFMAWLMVVLGVAPGASADSPQEPSGVIAGRVTLPAGTTPSSVSLQLYALVGEAPQTWMDVQYARAYDDGSYVFTGLRGGTYLVQVRVDVEPGSPQVATTFHGGSLMRTATRVTVVDGARVDGIDVAPPRAGEISGVVSVPAGFDGSRVQVDAWVLDDDGSGPHWIQSSGAVVEAGGRYAISQLAPGSYRVSYTDLGGALEREFHDDVPTVERAQDVVVRPGSVTVVDTTLGKGATIVGRVTQVGGGGVAGARVSVLRHFDEGGDQWWETVAGDMADDDGRYEVTGLSAGTYRVHFEDLLGVSTPGGLISEYHSDAATGEDATDLVVGHRQAVTVDAALAVGAAVSGTVTSPQGLMVRSVEVRAFRRSGPTSDPQWQPVNGGFADVNGDYLIRRLPAGTYRFQFVDSSRRWFTSEYFDDVSTLDEARDVVVGEGAAVTDIDASMGTGAAISGIVRASDARRVAGVEVTAYTLVDGTWTAGATATVGASGRFELVGLGEAAHRLGFRDPSGRLFSEYYSDVDTVAEARDVVVGGRQRISGIVAELQVDPDAPWPAITIVTEPSVTGDAVAGTTLSVTDGEWSPASASTTYQWFVSTESGERALSGETGRSLALTEALGGKRVRVRVTASAPGWVDAVHDSEWSATVTVPRKSIQRVGVPKVTGKAKVGRTLRVSRGAWKPGVVTVKYQWFVRRGGRIVTIAKATKSSLKLTKALRGKQVRVRLVVTAPGHTSYVHTTGWSKKVKR